MLRLLRMNARGRFDRTRHVIHPRRDMLSGSASAPRAEVYGFGMGHVLRINSLRGLWMSFLAYNSARAGLVLLRGDVKGAQLCLAQTRGLWSGFLAAVPAVLPALAVLAPKLPSLHPVKDFPQFKSGGAHSS